MPLLQGRVFTRLREFEALPDDFQHEVAALEGHLASVRTKLFNKHHSNLVRSAVGVRYRELLERVEKFVHNRKVTQTSLSANAYSAKKLVDGLILKGFLTPFKEDEKFEATATKMPFVFKDSELFVPLARSKLTTTVWDLVDGAVFAARMKRKAGLLATVTQGKDVYVVVNSRELSLTLFDSDVGRDPIEHISTTAGDAFVVTDRSHYDKGVSVWNEVASELFNASSVDEREKFIDALRSIGMKCPECGHTPLQPTTEPARPRALTETEADLEPEVAAADEASGVKEDEPVVADAAEPQDVRAPSPTRVEFVDAPTVIEPTETDVEAQDDAILPAVQGDDDAEFADCKATPSCTDTDSIHTDTPAETAQSPEQNESLESTMAGEEARQPSSRPMYYNLGSSGYEDDHGPPTGGFYDESRLHPHTQPPRSWGYYDHPDAYAARNRGFYEERPRSHTQMAGPGYYDEPHYPEAYDRSVSFNGPRGRPAPPSDRYYEERRARAHTQLGYSRYDDMADPYDRGYERPSRFQDPRATFQRRSSYNDGMPRPYHAGEGHSMGGRYYQPGPLPGSYNDVPGDQSLPVDTKGVETSKEAADIAPAAGTSLAP